MERSPCPQLEDIRIDYPYSCPAEKYAARSWRVSVYNIRIAATWKEMSHFPCSYLEDIHIEYSYSCTLEEYGMTSLPVGGEYSDGMSVENKVWSARWKNMEQLEDPYGISI